MTLWPALIFVTLAPIAAGTGVTSAAAPRGDDAVFVTITVSSEAILERLHQDGFNVTNVQNGDVTLWVTPDERRALVHAGFRPMVVPESPLPSKGEPAYDNYASLTAKLETHAAAHSDIARLYTLGQSVEGRELWAFLITENPDVKGDKPQFKYVSTMHGDEPVGTQLCLYFIERLLTGYGTDLRVTMLVNNTAIWIVPLMNPDGLERSRRGNANGIDLNRAFPIFPTDYTGSIFDGEALHDEGRQPEVAHVMLWTAANSFTLSANLHTGALLVNYPYDHTPGIPSGVSAPTPDEALFRELSLRYAMHNPPMFASPFFEDGITNGSDWFAITGGMQDWNYRYAGVPEVTIELSDIKRPPAEQLPQFWADNEESMIAYLEAAHIGVRGIVMDRLSGEALYAKVMVVGNEQPVFTDPDVGNYHRLLLPGEYGLTIHAPGYISRREVVQVEPGPATRLDTTLSDGDINGDGVVDATDVQLVVNAILQFSDQFDCDVDGGGLASTDLQAVVNQALSAPPNRL